MTQSVTSAAEISLDAGQATWDILAVRIDSLIHYWESSQSPPLLSEFLPAGSESLRRLVLCELIKVDLDYRYQRKQAKRIEDYAAEFPFLSGPSGPPCDLIFEEFQIRRRHGESVSPSEYVNRFPGQGRELARLLDVHEPTIPTSFKKPHPEASINAGERLEDFDLQVLLGQGAFAKVFLAWQRSMQRRVAVKVSSDRGDEPQTLAQLDHPNIVRVYDQRQIEERGLRLLYMPYLPGGTLHDVLKLVRSTPVELRTGRVLVDAVDASLARRGEPAPADSLNRQPIAAMTWPEVVCHLGARLAEALAYAHRQGVLHRDIKPANVLLGADASPRLADFNVGTCSKVEGAGPAAFFGGSIPYMSPEQIEAFNPSHPREPGSLDGRCDVYSLAITLWELLTGARPFADEKLEGDWGETLAALTVRRKAGLDSITLATLPANTPPGLSDVLQRALCADREHRFANAAEFAWHLDLCLKPRARELLLPEPGWRTWVRRWPIPALYVVGLLPNIVASVFSIEYNKAEIIDSFPAAYGVFRLLQVIVNGSFFPLGMILFGLAIWPVVRGLRALGRGPSTVAELAHVRERSLLMGPYVVAISLCAWFISGLIFPLTLHLTVHEMPASIHLHFLASQCLCGLIAVAYPLFGMHFLALRAIYPAFLPQGDLPAEDAHSLRRLDRSLGWFLMVAALVPMLAVGLLAGLGSANKVALVVLSAIGMGGFGLAYALSSSIRADISALLALRQNLN